MIIFWGLMRLRIFKKSGLIYYIHQVGTSISVVVLLLLLMNPPSVPAQRIYSDYSVYDNFDSISEAANYYVNVWMLLLVTLALLQLCWIAQLVSGLRKR